MIKELISEEELNKLFQMIPVEIKDLIIKKERLIVSNLEYLKEINVTSFKEIFLNYPEIFLQEISIFRDFFQKFNTSDLINRLNNDISIIETL